MSMDPGPRCGLAGRCFQRIGSGLRLLLRPVLLSLVAVLLAIARGLAGPRYRPPHVPQNPVAQVEQKR